jgi:hypothetical protein
MIVSGVLGADPLEWPRYAGLTIERYHIVRKTAGAMLQAYHEDNEWGAYVEYRGLTDMEEVNVLWAILRPHSSLRSAIKRLNEAERAGRPNPVNGSERSSVADPGGVREATEVASQWSDGSHVCG